MFKRAFLLLIMIALSVFSACQWKTKRSYSGYTDTLYLYISSPTQGYFNKKFVEKGQSFRKKQILYELDSMPDQAQYQAANAQYLQAKKIYVDLKRPKRSPEIAAIEYQIEQINANISKTNMHLTRLLKLQQKQFVDPDTVYTQQKSLEELQFQKKQLQENLKLAHMGARRYQIQAQGEAMMAAQFRMQEIEWDLAHKKASAPKDGYVFDIFYSIGELIPANKPVMSVVLPENNYIEFFVSAKDIHDFKFDQEIAFQYYGEKIWHGAHINYISQTAEYMPPVLYTQEHQDELVFRVRAHPDLDERFILGQPILIRP